MPKSNNIFHEGIEYSAFLKQIHNVVNPSTYFEIGVAFGATLNFANCTAVAVDPKFQLKINATGTRAETYYFQMSSDVFFRNTT